MPKKQQKPKNRWQKLDNWIGSHPKASGIYLLLAVIVVGFVGHWGIFFIRMGVERFQYEQAYRMLNSVSEEVARDGYPKASVTRGCNNPIAATFANGPIYTCSIDLVLHGSTADKKKLDNYTTETLRSLRREHVSPKVLRNPATLRVATATLEDGLNSESTFTYFGLKCFIDSYLYHDNVADRIEGVPNTGSLIAIRVRCGSDTLREYYSR